MRPARHLRERWRNGVIQQVAQERDGGRRHQRCVKPRARVGVTGDQDETSHLLAKAWSAHASATTRRPGMADDDRALDAKSPTGPAQAILPAPPGSRIDPEAVHCSQSPAGRQATTRRERATRSKTPPHDPVVERDGIAVEEHDRRFPTDARCSRRPAPRPGSASRAPSTSRKRPTGGWSRSARRACARL